MWCCFFTYVVHATGTPPVGDHVSDSDTAFVDVINPAIDVQKTPDTQQVQNGDNATFTITVTNTGDVDLTDVTVTDLLALDCEASLGTLAVSATSTYQCTEPSVIGDFTNSAIATGTPPVGNEVFDTDTADVDVIGATCTMDVALGFADGMMTWTFVVGATEPSTWSTSAIILGNDIPLWSIDLPALDPPITVPISFPLPPIGIIEVQSILSGDPEDCSASDGADTGVP